MGVSSYIQFRCASSFAVCSTPHMFEMIRNLAALSPIFYLFQTQLLLVTPPTPVTIFFLVNSQCPA